MSKFKRLMAGVLSAVMVLSLSACEEEVAPVTQGGPDGGNNAPGTTTAPTTSATTTTRELREDMAIASVALADQLDYPDLEVTKRLKWMAWWDIDETTAQCVLFKEVYGIPETGDDPDRAGRIFEYSSVPYGDRYDRLSTAISGDDSPDFFPFEIRDFPYGALVGRYQPVNEIINPSSPKWESKKELMEQFCINGKYYCAIFDMEFNELMYYRRSVIDELGLGDPRELFDEGNWTWDTFLAMARAFQQSGDMSDPAKGKYVIDGYDSCGALLVTTGVPLVGNDGTKIVNNMNEPAVERGIEFLHTLQVENLRYPLHELNGWSINPRAWAEGQILFHCDGGTWTFGGQTGLHNYAARFDWDPEEITVVPVPRDPSADQYYVRMKINPLMWVRGSKNPSGVQAYLDCCVVTALDPEVAAASKAKSQEDDGWTDYNYDFIQAMTKTDGSSPLTPVFDFREGLGRGVSDDVAESPANAPIKMVYLTGDQTYTELREQNAPIINARIDEINAALAG